MAAAAQGLGAVIGGGASLLQATRQQQMVPTQMPPAPNSQIPTGTSATQALQAINPQAPQYPTLAGPSGGVQSPDLMSLLNSLSGRKQG